MGKAQPSRRRAAEDATTKASRTLGPLLNKSLGQHILCNPLVAKTIVEKAGLKETDTVLEIGPGTGNLTVRLLESCRKVIAVEMDPRMAAELAKRVQGKPYQSKLHIVVGDFLKTELPYFDVCVSNTPYQISAPLLLKLLAHRPLYRAAVLMFQREFAMRMLAKPGDPLYGRLAVNTQLYVKVSHLMKVGRNNFRPPPRVESSVVRIEPIYPLPTINFAEWDGMMRICFTRKNRVLAANFTASCVLELCEANFKTYAAMHNQSIPADLNIKALVHSIVTASGFAESRAAKLDSVDFMELLLAFNLSGIHFAS